MLWRANTQDAASRVLESSLGNGLKEVRKYSEYTGRERDSLVSTIGGATRLHENYDYDKLGNVLLRGQFWDTNGFQETFDYDALNRLKSSEVSGQAQQQYTYFADGSIKTKTGVGTGDYLYPVQGGTAVRPHAVEQITGFPGIFSYDDNGNLLRGGGRTATWTTFDMPGEIVKEAAGAVAGSTSAFVYGPEHQRLTQTRSDGTVVDYAGSQEVESKGGQATVKTYWPLGLGVEIDKPGAATELDWTHLDRLGSPIAISDSGGNLKEKLAFDAWGKRRTINGGPSGGMATPDSLDGITDNRGFTGHEMLDQLDLVHMNGRVYDPLTARFLTADPLVEDPVNGQSYNRYSYVFNNPTNLTDPTGFSSSKPNDDSWIAEQAAQAKRDNDIRAAGGAVYYPNGGDPRLASLGGAASRQDLSNQGWQADSANTPMTPGQRNFLENSVACAPACVGLGGGAATGGLGVGAAGASTGGVTPTGGLGDDLAPRQRSAGERVMGEIDAAFARAGQRIDTAWKQLGKLLSKSEAITTTVPTEYQYALVATRNGPYPDVRNGMTNLTIGMIWKYGTTVDPAGRYPASALANFGLQMVPQTAGNAAQVLTQEKLMLIQHYQAFGTLPPGNFRFK